MRTLLTTVCLLALTVAPAQAGIGKAAQEAAEFVLTKFGMKAVREGGEAVRRSYRLRRCQARRRRVRRRPQGRAQSPLAGR